MAPLGEMGLGEIRLGKMGQKRCQSTTRVSVRPIGYWSYFLTDIVQCVELISVPLTRSVVWGSVMFYVYW